MSFRLPSLMNSTAAAVFFVLAAVLSGADADWIDNLNCNRTYFTHGVSMCQRMTLERLARTKDVSCDSVYEKQVTCIDSHVNKCLEGTSYIMFKGLFVDLLKVITFNCGTVNQNLNSFVFQQLNCKAGTLQNFEQAAQCWNDFVTKYRVNRKDPALCRSLADAKTCVTNITNHYCPAVKLETDSCNPFCANGTDNHRQCPVLSISLTCKNDFYYEKEKECERMFIDVLTNKTNTSASCSSEVPKLKSCIKKHFSENCFNPLVDNVLLGNLTNAVLSVTKGQRMFCNAVTITNRSAALRDIIPCESGPGFYEQAEDCVKEFREKFLANRTDRSLCSVYAQAKSCYHRLQVKDCKFSPTVLQITNDTYNPFCVVQSTVYVSSGLNMYSTWSTLILSLLVLIVSCNWEIL